MFEKYKKLIFPGIAVLLLIVLGYFSFQSTNKKQVTKNYNLEVKPEEHIKGNSEAKVTLVEYGDFQCPACGIFYSLVKQLLIEFPNDLRVVYRHFPLTLTHKNALAASRASEAAANQGKFWEMHDMLFEGQEEWSNLVDPKDKFLEYAQNLELDKDQFLADYESNEIEERIKKDTDLAESLGLSGTPTFFVNNQLIDYPDSYETFKKTINNAISN